MKIAVMGTGGVGGYYGGRLAASGQNVTFIARGEHLEAIRQDGLRVKSVHGDAHVTPAQATDDPATIGPVDVVLFCVKLWDTRAAAEMCRPLIGENTAVISLQNGAEKEDVLAEVLGEEAVLGGLCRIVSYIEEPGVIRHESQMHALVFGERDGKRSPRADVFLEACELAGIDATLSDDITRDIWLKFLFICALSGMTSLTRQPIGPIMAHPGTRDMVRRCMQEAYDVGRAKGANLPQDAVEDNFNFADRLEPSLTSSMQRDLEAGNRLEVGSLNGVVAHLGRELGVETPVNQVIHNVLQFYEDGAVT